MRAQTRLNDFPASPSQLGSTFGERTAQATRRMNQHLQDDEQAKAGIVLWQSQLFIMTYRVRANVLVLKRTSHPLGPLTEYERECAKLQSLMTDNQGVRGIVIDMRDARPRQDEAYEAATRGVSQTTFALFPKVAMLFRSVAGALQMRRFVGDRGGQLLSTTDEAEAFVFASNRE